MHCHHSPHLGGRGKATYGEAPGILCIRFGGGVRVPQQCQAKRVHHLAQNIVSLKSRQYLKIGGADSQVQSGTVAPFWILT